MRDDDDGPEPTGLVQTGRGRVLLVTLVVTALIALPAVVLLLRGDDQSQAGTGPGEEQVEEPVEEWRAEAWRGVQVRVPADWAVGGAPQADGGSAGLVQCGGAVVDGAPVAGVPYVGRPVGVVDECEPVDPDDLPAPAAAYVWLGSPVATGELSWDNGYTAETVAVGGQAVTVATDDDDLRAEILATVEALDIDDHGCPQTGQGLRLPVGAVAGPPERLAICVYDAVGRGGGLDWSGAVGAVEAGAFVDSLAGVSDQAGCRHRLSEQWAVLRVESGGGTAAYVVDFRCGVIRMPRTAAGDDPVARLRPATVEPWALPGVRAYVRAASLGPV